MPSTGITDHEDLSALARAIHSIRIADQVSMRFVAELRRPALDMFMRGLSRAGDWQTWTVLSLVALSATGSSRALALQILPKLLITLAISRTLKKISRRPRPSKSLHGFSSLLKDPDPYSFPSSHSACAWAVAVGLSAPASLPRLAYFFSGCGSRTGGGSCKV